MTRWHRGDKRLYWQRVALRLRIARGTLSQRAFARELGVSQPQLQRIELGQPPSAAFLIAYGKSGRSIEWLLFEHSSFGMLWPKKPAWPEVPAQAARAFAVLAARLCGTDLRYGAPSSSQRPHATE